MSWGLVGRIIDNRAKYVATQPLNTRLWHAAGRLLAAARRAGRGAGDGQPVVGAVRVPHPRHPGGARQGDGEAVHVWLAGGVADTTESSLMSDTDGVLLVRQLQTLTLL